MYQIQEKLPGGAGERLDWREVHGVSSHPGKDGNL